LPAISPKAALSRTALFVNRIIRRQWWHLLVAVFAPSWVKFPWQIMGFYFLMNWPNLSARAYHKIMQVSRTIADLVGDDRVGRAALAEALAYRAMPLLA
jgi:hypothetical protein